ncbi:MAG: hypothetical protein KDA28_16730, partial [Phycisphaerales bacterium]|nr:hypothetical protein [Phycisphaerales bacterium]
SALKLLGRFLAHPNKEIVAAAMEACVDLGDPAAIPLLEKFSGDERVVSIEDFEDEMSIRLGELAEECMAELDADGE